MKTKVIWIIFFLAIVSLLLFQTIWLYNTYELRRDSIEKNINRLLHKSIEEETENRISELDLTGEFEVIDEKTYREDPAYQEATMLSSFNKEDVFESGIYQFILHSSGVFFSLNNLDSLFQANLNIEGLNVKTLLTYKDSVGVVIEQAGNLPESQLSDAFPTEAILIVNGNRVQAYVDIPPAVVFKQMAWLLAASFAVLLIILYCIVYQTKAFFTQYKLNRLRDDFTHALTHDMKTPLGTINTVLSHFRSGLLDNKPEAKEKFGRIGMDQVASLLALVEKILTIAKSEEGELVPDYSETNIPQMIQKLKERFSISEEKEVRIQSSEELEGQIVLADKTLITNATANLVDNAVKYSGKSVEIEIDAYIRNEQLFIRVKDNGFGISPKDQQKIFKKFERGAAVKRREAKGFGLGLSYVKRVAEAHGGIVTLFSAEGKGSEFAMVIPLRRQEELKNEECLGT